jgi:hypothetical protein
MRYTPATFQHLSSLGPRTFTNMTFAGGFEIWRAKIEQQVRESKHRSIPAIPTAALPSSVLRFFPLMFSVVLL